MRLEYRTCIYLLILVQKMVLRWYAGEVENSDANNRIGKQFIYINWLGRKGIYKVLKIFIA